MKRKYARKALQSKSSLSKEESNINIPPDILEVIERTVASRKALGLQDDREERIERAIRYQKFIKDIATPCTKG